MHPSSFENMHWCYRRYAAPRIFETDSTLTVLDVGGADYNGSYADIFRSPKVRYLGMDLAEGPGVEIVLEDPYRFPLPDCSIDFVISGQMLEHCDFFWRVFAEMIRVLKPEGFLFLIVPSAGPIHRYPIDCYRYYPDAYRALARYAGCHLVDLRHDERGPWKDLVGVFSKTPHPRALPHPSAHPAPAPLFERDGGSPEEEVTRGSRHYLEVMAELHDALRPGAYLEIGVRHGRSLRLASCPALGVDPDPDVKGALPDRTEILRMTSDDFFELEEKRLRTLAPDLVFIDGMHLFEFVLRDFMNIERSVPPGTIVVVDDIFPGHPSQATRTRSTRVWTGDVWRLLETLQKKRSDLSLYALDAAPTGLLLIAGLDARNRVLWEQYNRLVRTAQEASGPPPASILERRGAVAPTGAAMRRVVRALERFRAGPPPAAERRDEVRRGLRWIVSRLRG